MGNGFWLGFGAGVVAAGAVLVYIPLAYVWLVSRLKKPAKPAKPPSPPTPTAPPASEV